MSAYLRVLARRAAKWEKLLEAKPVLCHSSKGMLVQKRFSFIFISDMLIIQYKSYCIIFTSSF